MTKSGLSYNSQMKILCLLAQYNSLTTRDIGAYIGYPWYPKCSAVRVTLHWMVRQGLVERIRPGLYRMKLP